MPKYRVYATWMMTGDALVEADSVDEAYKKGQDASFGSGEYLKRSLEIDEDCIELEEPNDQT